MKPKRKETLWRRGFCSSVTSFSPGMIVIASFRAQSLEHESRPGCKPLRCVPTHLLLFLYLRQNSQKTQKMSCLRGKEQDIVHEHKEIVLRSGGTLGEDRCPHAILSAAAHVKPNEKKSGSLFVRRPIAFD